MELGNQLISKITSSINQSNSTTLIVSTLLPIISIKLLYNYLNSSSKIKDISERKKVVIVGGGYTGISVATQLDSKFDVTVIERNQAFFHYIGSLRCVVEPEFATKSFFSYDRVLKNGKIVHGTVTQVTTNNVILADKQQFTFDYLVIATGSNNITPFKAVPDSSNAYQYYRSIHDKIQQATKILIVGGGAVGVELAGEIATDFKGKNVTLLNRGEKLISPQVNDKFSKRLNEKLEQMNVKLMLGTKIQVPEDVLEARRQQSYYEYNVEMKTYNTDKGDIEADLVFWTVGNKSNSEALGSFPLNEFGQIKVNQSLQVEGQTNIFALGDITDIQEIKTLVNAEKHIPVVVNNIEALSGNKTKLSTYQPKGFMFGVSIGRKDGMGIINNMVLPSFIITYLKSKTLMVEKTYKLLGKPKPANIGQ